MEVSPLAGVQGVNGLVQDVAGELFRQGRTDALIRLLKGLTKRDWDERQSRLPAFKSLLWVRCQSLK